MSLVHSLQIADAGDGPPLTPQQQRFNTLLGQIEQARGTLAAWHEGVEVYRRSYAAIVEPLQRELAVADRAWALALDALACRRGWSKVEQETLSEVVRDVALSLLEADDADAELKMLFAKHCDVDFETERERRVRLVTEAAERETRDDDGRDTDDDRIRRMRDRTTERADAAEESMPPPRRKTSAERRREAEARQATQSVREVFRKLASALHPDREADAAARDRKTALMQQVNQAYAAEDLLALLELQLRIEQIDANHIANAGTDRLKHYNKVLAEQLAGIRAEIGESAARFGFDVGAPLRSPDPRKLGRLVQDHRQALLDELVAHRQRMRMLADVTETRHWLKQQRRGQRNAFDAF